MTTKLLPALLLLAGCACAQVPAQAVRRDSLPEVSRPDAPPMNVMPNACPDNSFYRNPHDPKQVVRATVDNMPVWKPDTSTDYTMIQAYPNSRMLKPPPLRLPKPMLPGLPKKP